MPIETGTILKMVATMLWTDGNVMQNVYACDIVGGAGPYLATEVVDDMVEWAENLYGTILGKVSNAVDGSQVQVYEWDAVGEDWDEVGSDPWAWDPTDDSDQLPRGVAALLNAKSEDADASAKKYIGGISETHASLGLWTSSLITDLVDYGGEWVQSFVGTTTGATFNPGVWSVVGQELIPFVATVIIPTIPAYQRRRKRGVGI